MNKKESIQKGMTKYENEKIFSNDFGSNDDGAEPDRLRRR